MILIFIRFNGIYNISVNFWMFEHISVDVLDPCFSLSWANMSGIFCLSDYSLLEPCCRISDIVSPELRKITIFLLKSTWALKEKKRKHKIHNRKKQIAGYVMFKPWTADMISCGSEKVKKSVNMDLNFLSFIWNVETWVLIRNISVFDASEYDIPSKKISETICWG